MSSHKKENGLFIFRRDYRIVDNTGLNLLNTLCENIYTVFIFTPEQVTNKNHYKSNNAIQFMIESLKDLASQISDKGGKLHTFFGQNDKIVSQLIDDLKISVVCFNSDYTPYSVKRDNELVELCKKKQIECAFAHDYYLHYPGSFMSASNAPYQKFTPYYNVSIKNDINAPAKYKQLHFKYKSSSLSNSITLDEAFKKFTSENENIAVNGGRQNAIIQLRKAIKTQVKYKTTHNMLDTNTSQLSAFIKFGCLSIREVYKAFHKNTDFVRQLIWRDFYANILFSFPKVLGHALKPKYNKIKWSYNKRYLEAWKKGQTGFPIVDAGMRELNTTGYMHNRARLIVASFLIKTLLLDWRQGEQYFATKLTDYDIASNNGNWQWVMGGGADSQPYFRIFNPWSQSKEHDPEANYIKKWIPELKDVPAKAIHNWDSEYPNYKTLDYVEPIVDYTEQKDKVLNMYKAIF